jgi:hypothetical protein
MRPGIALLSIALACEGTADLERVDVQAAKFRVCARLIVRNDKNTVLEEILQDFAAHASGHPHFERATKTAAFEQTF